MALSHVTLVGSSNSSTRFAVVTGRTSISKTSSVVYPRVAQPVSGCCKAMLTYIRFMPRTPVHISESIQDRYDSKVQYSKTDVTFEAYLYAMDPNYMLPRVQASTIRGSLARRSSTSSIGNPHVKSSQMRTFSVVSPPLRSSSSIRLRTLPCTFANSRGRFFGSMWIRTRFGMNVERMSSSRGEVDDAPIWMNYKTTVNRGTSDNMKRLRT